jgi:biopolymer transport protein ExbD
MSLYNSKNQAFNQINITPLTDVMLVLLVIMILVAPLTSNTVLKIAVPQKGTSTANNQKDDSLKISVRSDGTVKFQGQTLSSNDSKSIQTQLEAEQKRLGSKDLSIELQADPLSQQKHVVAVMDAAAGAGVTRLTFLPAEQSK